MTKNEMKIDRYEFCRMLNCKLDHIPIEISQIDTTYRYASFDEFQKYMLYVLRKIEDSGARETDKNLEIFEKGWKENLEMLVSGRDPYLSLKPKYFRPNKFFRYNDRLIVSNNLDLEYDIFTIIRHIIFTKYLYPFNNIYELGCGSCHNLLSLSQLFPSKKIFGLDWTTSSIDIAKRLSKIINSNIDGIIFNMLKPSSDIVLEHGSAIITMAALEQMGKQYDEILSFIIKSRPGIVIHYEPIIDLYSDDNIFDYIAMLYHKKRNYLSDYYKTLCTLEKENKIEILDVRRLYFGNIVEASLIVWRPL